MNKRIHLLKVSITALLTTLMAGSAAQVLMNAMNVEVSVALTYAAALFTALLCMAVSFSRITAVLGAVLGAGGLGYLFSKRPTLFSELIARFSALRTSGVRGVAQMQLGALPGILAAVLLALLFYVTIYHRHTALFALLTTLAVMIGSFAVNAELPLWTAIPGLVAAVAVYAWSGPASQDMLGGWRALVPAVLAVALAFAFVPAEGTTWEPLRSAAELVRRVFTDYFDFTAERVPYTLYSKGYDRVAEVDGEAAIQLGGPAQPSEEEELRVTTDRDLLLRGAIYRTYTGSAWQDTEAKKRYLYYDITRRSTRRSLFNQHDNELLEQVKAQVEVLREGASALFVPTRMADIEMSGGMAVYYNSVGEVFLARQVQEGDSYTVTACLAADDEAQREAVMSVRHDRDPDYRTARDEALQLPEGIDREVYSLVTQLIAGKPEPYDRAVAIGQWLTKHCRYTLKGAVPAEGTDFVSDFVLRTRRGYCSYFASAMTVMCRIAGLPARYVEGYSVRASEDGAPVTVTGYDAHAWTEVYFNGIGWIAFDVTVGAQGYPYVPGNDEAAEDDDAPSPEDEPKDTPTPQPDETPAPTPDPVTGLLPERPSTPTPPPLPDDPDDPIRRLGEHPLWQWLLIGGLLLLLLILAVLLWLRHRLRATDPIRLSERAGNDERAAMILYRSILTLLSQLGQTPMNGETPAAFAKRIGTQLDNEAFVAFTESVTLHAYADRAIEPGAVECGVRAYRTFLERMTPAERRRFDRVRIRRGLGNFDVIP